jgi:hypothetical protein
LRVEDVLESFGELWLSSRLLSWSSFCGYFSSPATTYLTAGVRDFFGERLALYFWFIGE